MSAHPYFERLCMCIRYNEVTYADKENGEAQQGNSCGLSSSAGERDCLSLLRGIEDMNRCTSPPL
jgi:hypothetical protein